MKLPMFKKSPPNGRGSPRLKYGEEMISFLGSYSWSLFSFPTLAEPESRIWGQGVISGSRSDRVGSNRTGREKSWYCVQRWNFCSHGHRWSIPLGDSWGNMYHMPQNCHTKGQGDRTVRLPIPISHWLKGYLGSVSPPCLGAAPVPRCAAFSSLGERTKAENQIAVLAHPWGESLSMCMVSSPCTESMCVAFVLLLY